MPPRRARFHAERRLARGVRLSGAGGSRAAGLSRSCWGVIGHDTVVRPEEAGSAACRPVSARPRRARRRAPVMTLTAQDTRPRSARAQLRILIVEDHVL